MENLIQAIEQLKKEKNALIMGHYYQRSEIQEIADYIGDSLALAQQAAKTTADDNGRHHCDVWRSLHGRNSQGSLP